MGLNSEEITEESASSPSSPASFLSADEFFAHGHVGVLMVAHPACRNVQTMAATKQAKERFDPLADAALVLSARGWHAGVIGIVAGRLAERFNRPVVMIAQDEHQGRPAIGSLRSVPGFDVHEPLMACREHLLTCGGHAAAAGLRIEAGDAAAA